MMESAENSSPPHRVLLRQPVPVTAFRHGVSRCRRYSRPKIHVRPGVVEMRDPGFQHLLESSEGASYRREEMNLAPAGSKAGWCVRPGPLAPAAAIGSFKVSERLA
jgi:hypothetical protein